MSVAYGEVVFVFFCSELIDPLVSHCRRTLKDEGHSAAGWGIGGFVKLLLLVQTSFVRAMGIR